MEYIHLPGGGRMPMVGYGTWQASEDELEAALEAALEAGYRHVDTAAAYENEHVVGRVLRRWMDEGKVERDELFVVTKLPPVGNRPEGVEKYLNLSLEALQLDYVDLYLVHTPFGFQDGLGLYPTDDEGNTLLDINTDLEAVWKAMEEVHQKGRAKAIGVSNFNQAQLQRILAVATQPPENLQIEVHPYLQQRELVEFCNENKISVCAYSPLGSRGTAKLFDALNISKELPDLLGDPVVAEIAEKHDKTSAQVLLRFTVQRGIAVIPKSTNAGRIQQNIQIFDFELSEEEMSALSELDKGEEGRVVDFSFFKGMSLMRNFISRVMDDLSSPVLDPSFGFGLPIRFVRQHSKQNKALANIINDKDALKINLDVRHFSPDELTVKVVEDDIVVEGKHEEKDDEHGAVSRHFVRRYRLPSKVDKSAIISSLSSDGILQIHAPKSPESEEDEREIPITLTNLPALEPEGGEGGDEEGEGEKDE